MHPHSPASLDLLRDLLLEIAGVDCDLYLLPSAGGSLAVALGGLDPASFAAVREAFLAEMADGIIPHRIELLHLAGAPPAAAVPWKKSPHA